MASRAADATIKGYYYQFDTSILRLLELRDENDTVVIEGIEDIDIKTPTELTTIQCKYLSKANYTPSAVREPISLMLMHFAKNQNTAPIKYTLYAHFTNETSGTIKNITLEELKLILTYKENKIQKGFHIENKLTDQTLSSFLTNFKFEYGFEFNQQQQYVLKKIKKVFNCEDFTADTFYYNNALKMVIDRAIRKDEADRTISKSDILKLKENKNVLYNEWYRKAVDKASYIKMEKNNAASLHALRPSKEKLILIGKKILDSKSDKLTLCSFIENLISKYYKTNSSLRDAKPITIVLDGSEDLLREAKTCLIASEIQFNDGHETIFFSQSLFLRQPLVRLTNSNKIASSSYSIRIISKSTLFDNLELVKSFDSFFNFSNEVIDLKKARPKQFLDIKYCDDLEDVFKILT